MNGYDNFSSVVSLAKNIRMECDGTGEITLNKETLKTICDALISQWTGRQSATLAQFKKVN